MMDISKSEGIVFNGGGVLGIAHIGALKKLEELDILPKLNFFAGASVGSLLAAALSLGATYEYMENVISNLDFKNFMDETPFDSEIIDASRLLLHYGWYKGKELEKFYKKVVHDLCGDENITLLQAYEKTGKYLLMTAYRANDGITVELTKDTYPHLEIYRALKWSSCYPFFFATEKVSAKDMSRYTGEEEEFDVIFADGGILENYPIRNLSKVLDLSKIIGLHLSPGEELDPAQSFCRETKVAVGPPSNIVRFGFNMANAIYTQSINAHVSKDCWARTIPINIGRANSLNFNLTEREKALLFLSGYQSMSKSLGLTPGFQTISFSSFRTKQ